MYNIQFTKFGNSKIFEYAYSNMHPAKNVMTS